MAEVFLCETGQLTEGSRTALEAAGIVVVEVADPSRCQFIRSSEVISDNDMLWAAVDALRLKTTYTDADRLHRDQFAQNIFGLIEAAHRTRKKREQAALETGDAGA